MEKPFIGVLGALFALASLAAPSVSAQRALATKIEESIGVLRAMGGVPERTVPRVLFKDAYAVAIIPGVQKAGFVIGGQYGKGVLVLRRGGSGTQAARQGWSNPVFLTLSGASVGWQIGVQSADIVLFFRTGESVERILRGKYTIGVGAAAAAGSLGREAGAVTDADLKAEIYSYSRTRGIFAGVMLQGASLDIDGDANAAYYGRDIEEPLEFLRGANAPAPPSAAALRKALVEFEASLSGAK